MESSLLTFMDVILLDREGRAFGPINGSIPRYAKLRVNDNDSGGLDSGGWEVFCQLLAGLKRPYSGYLEEINVAVVQWDRLLSEGMDQNMTVVDFLQSPDAPEYVWMDQRRRSIDVLIDRLGLTARDRRISLKLLPPEIARKFLALRLLVSRADLLMFNEALLTEDVLIGETFKSRWNDLPGGVICLASRAFMPDWFGYELDLKVGASTEIIQVKTEKDDEFIDLLT